MRLLIFIFLGCLEPFLLLVLHQLYSQPGFVRTLQRSFQKDLRQNSHLPMDFTGQGARQQILLRIIITYANHNICHAIAVPQL